MHHDHETGVISFHEDEIKKAPKLIRDSWQIVRGGLEAQDSGEDLNDLENSVFYQDIEYGGEMRERKD